MREEFYPLSDPLAWKLLEEKYGKKLTCLNISDLTTLRELEKKWTGTGENPFGGLTSFVKKHQSVIVKKNNQN